MEGISWIDKVKVKEEKGKGRYLICTKDVEANELIAKAKPYLLVVNENRREEICDYCYQIISNHSSLYDSNGNQKEKRRTMDENKNNSLQNNRNNDSFSNEWKCSDCNQVYYCSQQCKEDAFKFIHFMECNSFMQLSMEFMKKDRKMTSSNATKRNQLQSLGKYLLRLLFKWDMETRTSSDMIMRNERLELSMKFENVLQLCTNIDSFPEKKLSLIEKVSKIVFRILKKTNSDLLKTLNIDYQFIFELTCREESNAFGLYLPLKDNRGNFILDKEDRLFAFGFYPSISLVNHSCSPNLYKTLEGTTYYYRALHAISSGTELCHSYIDLDKNTNQRRQELENNYGFYCTCTRCQDDNMLDDPFTNCFLCEKMGCGGLLIIQGSNSSVKKCHKCGNLQEMND